MPPASPSRGPPAPTRRRARRGRAGSRGRPAQAGEHTRSPSQATASAPPRAQGPSPTTRPRRRAPGGGQRQRTQEDSGLGGTRRPTRPTTRSPSPNRAPEGSPLSGSGGGTSRVVDDAPAPRPTPGFRRTAAPRPTPRRGACRGSERPVEREMVGLFHVSRLCSVVTTTGRAPPPARRPRGWPQRCVWTTPMPRERRSRARRRTAGCRPAPLAEATTRLPPPRPGCEGTGLVEAEDDGLEAPAVEAAREPDDDLPPPRAERPDDLGDADHALPRPASSASIVGMSEARRWQWTRGGRACPTPLFGSA